MASDWSSFLSRDDLLGGLPARRASTILYAIENHTAHLVKRSRQAMATYLTPTSAVESERAFLDALGEGRDRETMAGLSVQDLERYAPRWADLAPADPPVRAAIARMLGTKYPLVQSEIPAIRQVLGLDSDEVQQVFQRLHGQPLSTIYAPDLPWRERLHWMRSRMAHRLETLPPFWTAFALTLTETVGAGVLALPIAVAHVGPLAGLVILILLGLVNVLTIAAVAEAVARNGAVRYGHAYFGRVVQDYLGRPGLWILLPSLLLFGVVALLAYYVGLSTTLADATGIPAEIWTALAFLAALAFLRRESLDATVAAALVVGAFSISLIVLLTLLTLPHVSDTNLRHSTVPFIDGEPFDASLLHLIFGVVLMAYFGHTSAGNCAAVVLQRDPSARSFFLGSIAAISAAIGLYSVWIVAVNGAVPPVSLAEESGTALAPLAEVVGSSVHLVGSIFVVIAMGMASIHVSLALFNQTRELLPAIQSGGATGGGWRALTARPAGRFAAGVLPIVLIFLFVEFLLVSDRESFAGPIGFLGVLTSSVLGGIFPMLMVIASRRKGDYALSSAWRLVGNPVVAIAVSSVFVASLILHGVVLWDDLYQQASALLVAGAVVTVAVIAIQRGAFRRRAVVEVRVELGSSGPAVVNVVAAGEPVAADVSWPAISSTRRDAGRFRSVEIGLPALATTELRVWAHQIDAKGVAHALPVLLEIDAGSEHRQFDLSSTGGQIVLPISGAPQHLLITQIDERR